MALWAATLLAAGTIGMAGATQVAAQERPAPTEAQLAAAAEAGSVRALLSLGRLRSERGDLRGAQEALRRALEIAPNAEEALSLFARVCLAARTPGPALTPLEALVRMHPEVAEYPYLLGVARLQVADLGGAEQALRAAVKLQPERPLPHIALGLALNLGKRFEEARESLAEALRLAPDNVEGLAALAEAEEGLGHLDLAERHAGRALARDPSHAAALLVIGRLRMQQERYADAREALEKAVAADPTSAKAHYQLSLACARLGDDEASRRHLELYRRAQAEQEQLIIDIRGRTRAASGDHRP